MLRRMILGVATVLGLAFTGCSTLGGAARSEADLIADANGSASVDPAAARRLHTLEDVDAAGVYAPAMMGSLANDSQDPIPIQPSPDALQSSDGQGRFRVGGHNPVARTAP